MAEITNEMVHASYDISKKIFIGELSSEEGVNTLHSQYGMNENSASYYIDNYKCMIIGEEYSMTMNEYATKYYLIKILLDNGSDKLKIVLSAVKNHLEHQEKNKFNNLVIIKRIYNKFLQILDNDCSDIVNKLFELLDEEK